MRRAVPALLALLAFACGGRTSSDQAYASFTELAQDGTATTFQFGPSEVECAPSELYPDISSAVVKRDAGALHLSILFWAFGASGTFDAAGEGANPELEPPLACSTPCVHFVWQHDVLEAHSAADLEPCWLHAERNGARLDATFECTDLHVSGGGPRVSLIAGKLRCAL